MNEPVVPILTDVNPTTASSRVTPRRWGDLLLAALGFAGFCALVLSHATALLEPDDYAYRASIVALQGHVLLSNAQFQALASFLAKHGEPGIAQWHHLASGQWVSEKEPGYPFFAVLFYMAKVLRIAPLFYGALACGGSTSGREPARRWAGAYAVWMYCFSGAALVFAWRARRCRHSPTPCHRRGRGRARPTAGNLSPMPAQLIVQSAPVAAPVAIWMTARVPGSTPWGNLAHSGRLRRDIAVAVVLVVGWLAMWILYSPTPGQRRWPV